MGGGNQSHHSGKIRGNKKASLRQRAKGFKSSYGSSSEQSSGYSSFGSSLGSSLAPCTQYGKMRSQDSIANIPHQLHLSTFSMAGSQFSGQQGCGQGGHSFGGILLVYSPEARILIDPGAMHSFVSPIFALRLGRNPTALEYSLSVAIPLSDNIDMNIVFPSSLVVVDEKIHPADLIPLPVMNFDVILGMDWLSTYYATLDYRNKKVYFHILGVEEFSFNGDRSVASYNLVSAISARKMLRHGCQSYLVLVRDTSVEGANAKNVPIFKEFMNIFPEELIG
ncbi:uncharacterized protein LOC131180640 [Hevea brasiliensis]|uniref:uncharacterized protein LOC131180640 n=1 Tax=Hevea brasiliensis TaxID=3981 RepID=UPI0025E7DF52|nr:uncharacterized protein LOC131180640 [Hevea brasiliensis]